MTPDPLKDDYVEVPVNQFGVALVSKQDFDKVKDIKWYPSKRKYTTYARSYVRNYKKTVSTNMHRLIMDAPKGMLVDHINGNGLDNRRSNLRICTKAENVRNMKARNGVSKFKGVGARSEKGSRPWYAQIMKDGKKSHLGYFETEKEAAEAYDVHAVILFGEFANTNFKVYSESQMKALVAAAFKEGKSHG